jgi:hypothetical protein
MTQGEVAGGLTAFGLGVIVICLVLDWELLTHKSSDCVVDGADPFRGAWMHMLSTKCTAQDSDTKMNPPAVGAVLQCLVFGTAHGPVCVGGQDLAGRKANAWFFLGLGLVLVWFGLGVCVFEKVYQCQRQLSHEYVQERFDVDVQMHAVEP